MENNNQDELTLSELLKVTFKSKLIVILSTVICSLVLFIGVIFIYNPKSEIYTTTFKLEFSGSEDGKYPDGSMFRHEDIITFDRLNEVKSSNEKYSSIDVEKMSNYGDITICRTFDVIDKNSYFEGFYAISVKANYFKNFYQAKDFINDLVNNPIKKYENIVSDMKFIANLEGYKNSNNFQDQLNFLESQEKFLLTRLDSMLEKYSGNFISQGKKLEDHYIEISMDFLNSRYSVLATDLEVNGYVKSKDVSYKRNVELQIFELQKEKADNEKTISDLKKQIEDLVNIYGSNQIQVFESFNEKIANLTVRNVEIDRNLSKLNTILTNLTSSGTSQTGNQDAFEAQMEEYYQKLVKYTSLVTEIIKDGYNYEKSLIFKNVSVIVSSNTVNPVKSLIGGVFLGLFIGCTLSLCINMPKYLKEKKQKQVENN